MMTTSQSIIVAAMGSVGSAQRVFVVWNGQDMSIKKSQRWLGNFYTRQKIRESLAKSR